jgi:hypothetical protein
MVVDSHGAASGQRSSGTGCVRARVCIRVIGQWELKPVPGHGRPSGDLSVARHGEDPCSDTGKLVLRSLEGTWLFLAVPTPRAAGEERDPGTGDPEVDRREAICLLQPGHVRALVGGASGMQSAGSAWHAPNLGAPSNPLETLRRSPATDSGTCPHRGAARIQAPVLVPGPLAVLKGNVRSEGQAARSCAAGLVSNKERAPRRRSPPAPGGNGRGRRGWGPARRPSGRRGASGWGWPRATPGRLRCRYRAATRFER